jgi:dTDP-4-dehydrorhamnose reductase
LALAHGDGVCIARIEMPLTDRPDPRSDFAGFVVARLRTGPEVVAVDDQKITPSFLDDAALALRTLLQHHWAGVIHPASTDRTPLALASGLRTASGSIAG